MSTVQPLEKIIQEEDVLLRERRANLYGANDAKKINENRFGIALSGGGLRSATVCLGVLKVLNKYGILKRSDYLSSVSGGGYTSGYVHTTLKDASYEELFSDQHITYIRHGRNYLAPEEGFAGGWNKILLISNYVVSLLFSWINPLILILLSYLMFKTFQKLIANISPFLFENLPNLFSYTSALMINLFLLHFLFKLFYRRNLDISNRFIKLTTILIFLIVICFGITELSEINVFNISSFSILELIIAQICLIALGYFLHLNALSFHYYFRSCLGNTFLHFSGPFRNMPLKDLFSIDSGESDPKKFQNPYPLFNTCLNFPSDKGPSISDYFLLSPLYCGSKKCGYIKTKDYKEYSALTVPSAMTASAAAVNPGMGVYSSGILSFFTTIFNIRLGYWLPNPAKNGATIVWWPLYYMQELLASSGLANRQINISDGGHVENLGVFELLRRNCRLVISIDAGADPNYVFDDLKNLIRRARNELGLEIRFRKDHDPNLIIRPNPTIGYYSKRRFAIADIIKLWEEIEIIIDEKYLKHLHKEENRFHTSLSYRNLILALENLSEVEQQEFFELVSFHQEIDNAFFKENLGNKNIGENIKIILKTWQSIIQVDILNGEKRYSNIPEKKEIIHQISMRINQVIKERILNEFKVGTFVYVKSSITKPERKLIQKDQNDFLYKMRQGARDYIVNHPSFPHEPTANQFFTIDQWNSYFLLGQEIAQETLNIQDYHKDEILKKQIVEVDDLIKYFDEK